MSKMREAFEKWILTQPSHLTQRSITFAAGYQAAIADVKAGGGGYFYHPVTGQEQGPLYKLPEDK